MTSNILNRLWMRFIFRGWDLSASVQLEQVSVNSSNCLSIIDQKVLLRTKAFICQFPWRPKWNCLTNLYTIFTGINTRSEKRTQPLALEKGDRCWQKVWRFWSGQTVGLQVWWKYIYFWNYGSQAEVSRIIAVLIGYDPTVDANAELSVSLIHRQQYCLLAV